MIEKKDEISREIVSSFKRLHQILHKDVLSSMGKEIKPSPFMVLMYLLRSSRKGEEGKRVSDIASVVGMTAASITQILNSLEKEGIVLREMDPKDRRAVLVYLTEKGKGIMEPASRHLTEKFSGLIEHLGLENSRRLAELLSEVEQYFNQ